MSLPPFLLKKLATRGLVNKNTIIKQPPKLEVEQEDNEEIIAEDYDEIEDPSQYDYEPLKKPQESFWKERMKRRIVEGNNAGYQGCPNKYNIYHKCTLFCVTQWGDGKKEPSRIYTKLRQRLLRKYPLPKDWQEIYDIGCGYFYYWNSCDDTVAWLPPSHPKSIISKSAATLRKELEENQPPPVEDSEVDGILNIGSNELTEEDLDKILNLPLPPFPKRPESPETKSQLTLNIVKKTKARDLDKAIRQQKAHKKQHRDYSYHYNEQSNRSGRKRNSVVGEDPLDPMDPASYSEIPRGKWSDGLNAETGQKSGVDSTVTGTLFQQRPYPSPGAILQANAAASGSNNNITNAYKKTRYPSENFDEDSYY